MKMIQKIVVTEEMRETGDYSKLREQLLKIKFVLGVAAKTKPKYTYAPDAEVVVGLLNNLNGIITVILTILETEGLDSSVLDDMVKRYNSKMFVLNVYGNNLWVEVAKALT